MASLELHFGPVTTPKTAAVPAPAPATGSPGWRVLLDYAVVVAAWALAMVAAATFPLDHPQVARVALFIHLVSLAIGFGSVIMIDLYGLLWLFGRRTLTQLVDLDSAAHTVIAVAVGGLLASGIALQPDLSTPLARFKMLLVLGLMLNGLAAQRLLARLGTSLPPTTRGDGIPWAAFQRGLAVALISQATWWGSIAIGFITTASRNSGS
ncbi:MAG TPA: hypothetical protein VJS45_06485 [Acidimicrobiia bacterium]|jgi:hypothetical protein|nr:hypothetical protein [Acidimicrobiia bacterium]